MSRARWIPHPDGAAVARGPAGARTIGDLERDVAAVADALGPPASDRVVACAGRYATAVAVLACWERGEVAVLPLNHTPGVLGRLAASTPVLHDGAVDADTPGCTDVRAHLGHGHGRAALRAPDTDRVVVRLSTSGSTGTVRLHDKTAGQLLGEVDVLGDAFDIGPADTVLGTIPPHHIYGLLFTVLLPLRRGAAFVDDAPLFPEAVAARARETGATVLVTVPAHLRALVEGGPDTFRGLRRVFSSGAPLPPTTALALASAHGLDATEVYGSTETGGIATRQQRLDPAWQPLPGVRVGADAGGRLQLSSPLLPPGTPQPRAGDDRIEPLPDGRFRLLGRIDDVVKIASRRVSLGAVEQALHAVPGVRDAVVIVAEDPGTGRTRLEALVVLEGVAPAEVRATLARELDPVVVPRLTPVERLPRATNGKLSRAALDAFLAELRAPGGRPRPIALVVPDAPPSCEGHFPGDPLLPGVAELVDLVLPAVARLLPDLGPLAGLRRLRFLAPVRPGDRLTLDLARQDRQVRFDLVRDGASVATGTLVYGGPLLTDPRKG